MEVFNETSVSGAKEVRKGWTADMHFCYTASHSTLQYFICHFRPGSFEAIQQEAFQTHDHKLANFKCDSFSLQRLTSDSIDVNLRIVNSVDPKAQFAAVHVASYKLCNKVNESDERWINVCARI